MTVRVVRADGLAGHWQTGAGKPVGTAGEARPFASLLARKDEVANAPGQGTIAGPRGQFASEEASGAAAAHDQANATNPATGSIGRQTPTHVEETATDLQTTARGHDRQTIGSATKSGDARDTARIFRFSDLGVFGLDGAATEPGKTHEGATAALNPDSATLADETTTDRPVPMASVAASAYARAVPGSDSGGAWNARPDTDGVAEGGPAVSGAMSTVPVLTAATAAANEPVSSAMSPASMSPAVSDIDDAEPAMPAPPPRPTPELAAYQTRDPVHLSVLGSDAALTIVARDLEDAPQAVRALLERTAAEFRCRIGELVLNGSPLIASPSDKGGGRGRHTR